MYARSDRYYVKKYEEETNLRAHLLLDISASMSYGSGVMTKREYGSCLAASLAYLMTRQRDAAGLVTFDDHILGWLQPSIRPGHLRALLLTLDRLPAGAKTDAGRPLHQLADALAKRGMIVLISDLLDDPVRVIDGLKHFRFRGNDVLVLHVLDHAELTFPFDRPVTFRDLETGEEVVASPVRGARAVSRRHPRPGRNLPARAAVGRHRLPAGRHQRAARSRAAVVPGRSRPPPVGVKVLAWTCDSSPRCS